MRSMQMLLKYTLGLLILLAGCDNAKKVVGSLGELQVVQSQVSRAVGSQRVSVNLNNSRHLTIGVVNSPLKSLPKPERLAKAKEIAQIAYDSYVSRETIETVNVTFVVHKSYFLVFNYNDATDGFRFNASELVQVNKDDNESTTGKEKTPNQAL